MIQPVDDVYFNGELIIKGTLKQQRTHSNDELDCEMLCLLLLWGTGWLIGFLCGACL